MYNIKYCYSNIANTIIYAKGLSAGLSDNMIITCMIHLSHLAAYTEIPQFWMQDTKQCYQQPKKKMKWSYIGKILKMSTC